jgi:hypothetical protein
MQLGQLTRRVILAAVAPFIVFSVFLVAAELTRNVWPTAFGGIQYSGLFVGVGVGLLFIPRSSVTRTVLISVAYAALMLFVL